MSARIVIFYLFFGSCLSAGYNTCAGQDTIYLNKLQDSARLFFSKSQYDQALPVYREILSLVSSSQGTRNDIYIQHLRQLGITNFQLRRLKETERNYLEAKSIIISLYGAENKEYAAMCNLMGVLYNEQAKYSEAIAEHMQARTIRKKTVWHGEWLICSKLQ